MREREGDNNLGKYAHPSKCIKVHENFESIKLRMLAFDNLIMPEHGILGLNIGLNECFPLLNRSVCGMDLSKTIGGGKIG